MFTAYLFNIREGLSWIKYIHDIGSTSSLGEINLFLQGSIEADLNSIKNAIIRMTHPYQGSHNIIPLHKLYCKGAAHRKLSKFIKNDSFSGEVQVWNKLMMECNINATHILSLTDPNICLFYRGTQDMQPLTITCL